MQENKVEVKEYEANWEENTKTESNFKKVFIPEDSYNANLKAIEVVELPDFNDKTKKLEKLALMFDIKEKGVELTHFLQPKISKGSTNKQGKVYSNSKLYDLLVDLNLKDKFKEEVGPKFTANKVVDFLNKYLTGKTLRVTVKTSKANTPEQYSGISKILRFVEWWRMDENLKKEIVELMRELQNQDSIEIGNSKTGVIKIYVNFDDPLSAERKLSDAITLLQNKRKEVLGE
jgi:hypothetical protein